MERTSPPVAGQDALRALALILVLAAVVIAARICSARSNDRRTAFFSANDRSRWLTVRALVEDGTYAIDRVRKERGWQSIDMVRHKDRAGQWHYYSSKPPLLATLLAPQYWLIQRTLGWTFREHPLAVGRTILLISNGIPLIVYLSLWYRWIERECQTIFGRVFMMLAVGFGTFLTTFANSLNNHWFSAVSVTIVAMELWRLAHDGAPRGWRMAVAGAMAAFAAANDLPALSFSVLASLAACWLAPRAFFTAWLPGVLIVACAFFATTWVAHGSLKPPYAHRDSGENWYDYPGSYWMTERRGVDQGDPSSVRYLFHVVAGHHGFFSLTPIWGLAAFGGWLWWLRGDTNRRLTVLMTIGLWLICVFYYVFCRPVQDHNYGGVACGFRWLFWLIPLWLMLLAPAADWASEHTWRRRFAVLLLGLSVFSATLPSANPWTHPWPYQLGLDWGWIAP